MKNITVMGGGVLGTQIAFQTAYSGFNVTIWLRSKGSIERTKPKLEAVKKSYIDAIKLMASRDGKSINNWCRGIVGKNEFNEKECLKKVEDAFKNIKLELDINKALKGADLVIESMTEDFKAKKDLYLEIAPLLDDKTIVVTNSSTMLPSKLAKYTGRPEKFLSLHFANSIWKNNTAEVMRHSKTEEKYFNEVMKFAENINMIALPLQKEKSGYLLNSMLIPLLFSGLDLYVNGISDPESIDKAWTLGTGSPKGPFQILDTVGLKTAHEIVLMYVKIPSFLAPYNFKGIEKLLKIYIDEGKLGMSSGEGFYKYNKTK
jgi:3-hydroxybutyryl-CoA dehydrogenase